MEKIAEEMKVRERYELRKEKKCLRERSEVIKKLRRRGEKRSDRELKRRYREVTER